MEQINNFINFFRNITQKQWLDVGIALIIILFFLIFSSVFSYLIIKMFKFREKDKTKIKNNPLYKPLKAIFIIVGVYIGIMVLKLPTDIMKICEKVFQILLICTIAKGLTNLVDPQNGLVRKMRNDEAPDGNRTVASFTSKILKYVIYIGAGLLILTVFGINPTSLIAGLGVGSAVVALAAQDFVKSLISGFSIMSDKPFLVGDWISVGTNEGTVLEISFRCTKIQTADNSVVTIPNSIFTTSNVVNWSRMKQRRYGFNIKLPLETNSSQMEKIVNKINFVLNSNEDIVKDSVQVHFDAIGLDSMNINIYMYTDIISYGDFLNFKQNVNENVLKVLESENLKMAYPGQNVYVHNVDETRDKIEEIDI